MSCSVEHTVHDNMIHTLHAQIVIVACLMIWKFVRRTNERFIGLSGVA